MRKTYHPSRGENCTLTVREQNDTFLIRIEDCLADLLFHSVQYYDVCPDDLSTYVIADTRVSRSPEEITLNEAFEQIEEDAVCSIDQTSDGTMKEALKMIDANLEARGGCTDAVDAEVERLAQASRDDSAREGHRGSRRAKK
jgi:hypothetical protein